MEFPITNEAAATISDGVESFFHNVPPTPEVPVYAVMAAYKEDPSPNKLNLGMGVYRTEVGQPYILNVVRRAEEMLVKDSSASKEYLPITGLAEFNKLSAQLVFGPDSPGIKDCRVTTVQCLSGSGSLRIGAEFLARHYHNHTVYLPQPTYGNHPNFFISAGLTLKTYRYYDEQTCRLDFEGLLEDLGSASPGAIILLQASGHNPTGIDPTSQQWEQIRQLVRQKGLLPFFDCAYQGFVSGCPDADVESVRMFLSDGGECLVAQSYSKTMGLYAERIGALNIVCKTAEVAKCVESQLKLIIRPMYSNPPIHGALIVTTILKNRDMYDEWIMELKVMTDRIAKVRQELFDALGHKGTPGEWSHIVKQVGMFTLSGLNEEQVAFMTKDFHIYMSADGRINMAGLSSKTVPYLADAIHAAVTRTR